MYVLFCYPSQGGVAQLVERVLYHSTRRAAPERLWVQSLLPSTEVEPGFSTFGGVLVPVLQLISPVCKTGTSLTCSSASGPASVGCVAACKVVSDSIISMNPINRKCRPEDYSNRIHLTAAAIGKLSLLWSLESGHLNFAFGLTVS
jgi:hypothetical protein